MKVVPHPLLERDLVGIAEHVFAVSGDGAVARKRISGARALIQAIAADPRLGTTLDGGLAGWRVRHGGQGRRITVVFRHHTALDAIFVALVAFGGRGWEAYAAGRSRFGNRGAWHLISALHARCTVFTLTRNSAAISGRHRPSSSRMRSTSAEAAVHMGSSGRRRSVPPAARSRHSCRGSACACRSHRAASRAVAPMIRGAAGRMMKMRTR